MRERDDFRNGIKELTWRHPAVQDPFLPQMLARPGWLVSYMLDGGLSRLPNVVIPGKGPMELIDVAAALARAAVTWDDLSWIRKHWPGPIVIKEPAHRRRRSSCRGCGRCRSGGLKSWRTPARRRVAFVAGVARSGLLGSEVEVLMDGDIRRGSDIVKAICLGAKAVLCGRAYAYGLAAAGEAGVTRALEILRVDLSTAPLSCWGVHPLRHSTGHM